jgi:uncharacterized protein
VGEIRTKVGGTADFVLPAQGGAYVKLRVSLGAKSTAFKGLYGESAIKLSVAAPPVEGKANTEVECYLARLFGVSSSDIIVVKGASSRDKLVFIGGCGPGEIQTRLNTLL